MALNKCCSLKNCFATQFTLTFASILLLTYLSCCAGCLLSFVGRLFIVSVISWAVAKKIRRRLNSDLIETSYKRAVLITGCDHGFGHELALKMNEHGFTVYATVLNPDGEGAKKLISGARFEGKTKVLRMDVTSDEEVNGVYVEVKEDLDKNGEQLWAVVNNAGIVTYGPLEWGSIDTYKNVLEVNTIGPVRVTRRFLPLLRQSKGRVVNLVSMAGRMTAHNLGVYSMSKHATISFSDALRRETKRWGIKVSTIEPTAYKTPMADEGFFEKTLDKQWTETEEGVKQLYGQSYFNNMKEKKTMLRQALGGVSENVHEVIDKMIDAVRNPDPQIRYVSVSGCFASKVVALLQILPNEMIDSLYKFKNRKEPKLAEVRNEE